MYTGRWPIIILILLATTMLWSVLMQFNQGAVAQIASRLIHWNLLNGLLEVAISAAIYGIIWRHWLPAAIGLLIVSAFWLFLGAIVMFSAGISGALLLLSFSVCFAVTGIQYAGGWRW